MVQVVVTELAEARDGLERVRQRLADTATHVPARAASGWHGLAALAYQRSLDALTTQLNATVGLLRGAGDLTSAAIWELGGHD